MFREVIQYITNRKEALNACMQLPVLRDEEGE